MHQNSQFHPLYTHTPHHTTHLALQVVVLVVDVAVEFRHLHRLFEGKRARAQALQALPQPVFIVDVARGYGPALVGQVPHQGRALAPRLVLYVVLFIIFVLLVVVVVVIVLLLIIIPFLSPRNLGPALALCCFKLGLHGQDCGDLRLELRILLFLIIGWRSSLAFLVPFLPHGPTTNQVCADAARVTLSRLVGGGLE